MNELLCKGSEALFFLDYYATGQLRSHLGVDLVSGIVIGCREAGCALVGELGCVVGYWEWKGAWKGYVRWFVVCG